MRPEIERRVRRWQEQRWLVDQTLAAGAEKELGRMLKGRTAGPEGQADFSKAARAIRCFDDIEPVFADAARKREHAARTFAETGRLVSARDSYFLASLLWNAARWPIFELNEASLAYERRGVECYDRFMQHPPHPVRRVEIPFGATSIPAYLHLPREPQAGERFPCAVTIGGLDGSKENLVYLHGDPMLARGFAVLGFDGPGQGESPARGLFTTPANHGDACVAIFDWLEGRPEIDMAKVVLKGSSFGTYWTTIAGAMLGKRVAAIAATSVCHEPGCHTIFNLAHPSFKQRFMYMSGYDDEAAFDRFVQGYDARPYAERVTCPYLMVAGQNDELSPIRFTDELYTHVHAPKQLLIFERATHAPDTGPGSTYATAAMTMLQDWLRDRVDGKAMESARIVVDAGGRVTATPFPAH